VCIQPFQNVRLNKKEGPVDKKYPRHALSALCGNMTPEEFIVFQDSIINDGVQEPALKWQGAILDGWHRYSTAIDNGMTCPVEEFEGTEEEARALVLRKHNRRNWTPSQRALAVVAIAAWHPPGKAAPGAGLPMKNDDLAADADVSERTIRQAKSVVRNAIPAVQEAVRDGAASLKKAAEVSKLPKRQQKAALAAPPAPAWRPVGTAPLPRPVVGASKEALDELKERNEVLCQENDRLTDRLAIQTMDATAEEKAMAETLIAELRADNRTLRAELDAVKSSRDSHQTEANELRKQCGIYRVQLAKHSRA
jgi:FtsZ-binding cell division protein ZapB